MTIHRPEKAKFCVAVVLLLFFGVEARAHRCGPEVVEVEAGKTALWRVYADRMETLSFYQPALAGNTNVAEVYPRKNFYAHHGDFLITGHEPGTNYLNVVWSYQPTGAAGVCQVMIVVKPDDGVDDLETFTGSGMLVARHGEQNITSSDLFFQIDRYIPRESPKLLVFAQCFGGNMALHSLFRNMPNTTVLSATSPDQEARYGGYHDDAARGLKPEAGRTAETVHEEGSIGKATIIPKSPDDDTPDPVDPTQAEDLFYAFAERPRVSGTLPPAQFSLEPVTLTGAVRSRHIVIFAGQPGTNSEYVLRHGTFTIPSSPSPIPGVGGQKEYFSDNADRDAIRMNFSGQPNTTIVTLGGGGTNGWDRPGDLASLHAAIQEAGQAIEASADPSKEQFILFVTDHGEKGSELFPTPRMIPGIPDSKLKLAATSDRTTVGTNLQPYQPGDPLISSMLRAVDNQPGVALRIALPPEGDLNPGPASLALEFRREQNAIVLLDAYSSTPVDLDGDGVVGSVPEEGIAVFFPMAEADFMQLLVEPFSLDLIYETDQSFVIIEALLVTGGISPGNSRPGVLLTGIRVESETEIEINVTSAEGERHVVETSSDLISWQTARELVFESAVQNIIIPTPPGAERLFIRVLRP